MDGSETSISNPDDIKACFNQEGQAWEWWKTLVAMGFKRKRVVASCFCVLFLLIFISLLLYILQQLGSGLCSRLLRYGKMQVKGVNDTFRLQLDTLQTFDMLMEPGLSESGGGVARSKLVGMPGARGLLRIPHEVYLSGYWPLGKEVLVSESSFAVSFTMSLYQPSWKETIKQNTTAGLAFLVLPPYRRADGNNLTKQLGLGADGSLTLSNSTASKAHFQGGGQVSVEIGRLPDGSLISLNDPNGRLVVVHVSAIDPAPAVARYTVWIEYARLGQCLSVYVDAGEVKERPDHAVAIKKNISYIDGKYWAASFGLYSSVGQLMQIHTWSTEVEGATYLMKYIMDNYMKLAAVFVALLLSLAATVATAAVSGVAWYFRTKRKRWKKEQDKLAKIMQSLPGVPAQVDFADIRKATGNFDETAKLGKGGFSSVYRCRLPAAACGRSSSTEVAVKKFTRGVEEQRYEDFLAEVSIINRLRHKNVVPLVGWSYNKGEPLLIYEYMTNGSLDQHLFRRGVNTVEHQEQQQQQRTSSIRQWHTRYSIVRDIATGLHYVHHEHEPMVLHRDIKASNIMLDSSFRARLGDFGIACTVAADKTSVTGVAGTWGYIAPDYAMSNRATGQTDIYAFGVLVLEVVTGKKNRDVPEDDGHISDWVWRLHGEGRLLDAVEDHQQGIVVDEAERLLLLGLACTNPNPANRPSMAAAVQVISKLAPPPEVPPERPSFVWPPRGWRSVESDYGTTTESNLGETTASTVELVQIMQD